mgnify:CR=1 FL=1
MEQLKNFFKDNKRLIIILSVIIIGIVALLFLAEEWHRAQKDK